MRRPALLSVLVLAACSSKPAPSAETSTPTPTAATAAVTATAAPSASAPAKAKAKAAKKRLTKEERAKFWKPLEEGRKKARAKDWKGALEAYDRALAVTPDDGVVLAEVGWAALNAPDLDRAEKANRRALALTKQPNLRAQILYNAGRVAEERKDKEAARKAYAESLALRENAEVRKRLAAVGGAPPELALRCAQGAPTIEALCKCLVADKDAVMNGSDAPLECAAEKTPALGDPRLSVVRYGAPMMGENAHVLVALDGKVHRPVAELGRDYEPGAFGVHNEATVKGGEVRTFGARQVAVVKSEQRNNDSNMAGLEVCSENEDLETVCLLGSGAALTRCFTVPVALSSGCGAGVEVDPAELDADGKASFEAMKKGWSTKEAKLSWSLDADGKVVVKKVSGDDALVRAGLVGAHAL